MPKSVFISHSSRDRATADAVRQFLEDRRIPCWIAPRDVPAGANWAEAIMHAIEEVSTLVLVFSEQINHSEQVKNEVERAVHHKKRLCTLKIDAASPSKDLEYFLSRHHWLDASVTPLTTCLEALVAAIAPAAVDDGPLRGPQTVVVLEATREHEQVKLSAYERQPGQESAVKHYAYVPVSFRDVQVTIDALMTLVQHAAQPGGSPDASTWQQIKDHGATLYTRLLTPDIQTTLRTSTARHLLLYINDTLVHIPWELLFDGADFLCRRFSLGRLVSTQQDVVAEPRQVQGERLRMLIIANPTGDLPAAAREGRMIEAELTADTTRLQIELRSAGVHTQQIKAQLAHYDVLHYAGHAEYHIQTPAQSGWLLADGTLTAQDVLHLAHTAPMAALVFCNACQSGQTSPWRLDPHIGRGVYGLANAFVLAGAQHYIGTCWAIPDQPSATFAISFYRTLVHGQTVGEALRQARQTLVERDGATSLVWASYVLYGDPRVRYVAAPPEQTGEDARRATPPGLQGVPQPPKRWRWTRLLGATTLGLCLAGSALLFWSRQRATPEVFSVVQTYQTLARGDLPQTDREAKIDRLVAELLAAYRADKHPASPTDAWKSTPLTLAFFRDTFMPTTGQDAALLNSLERTLRASARVTVIEREVLERMLGELKLSTTDLVDPTQRARLGKLLAAKFVGVGSITHLETRTEVSLRLIETATSDLIAHKHVSFGVAEAVEDVAAAVTRDLLAQLRQKYPLQGRIARVTPEMLLDIGAEHGVVPGITMQVIVEEPIRTNDGTTEYLQATVGEIVVTTVQARLATARVVGEAAERLQQGWKVREKAPQGQE